MLGRPRKNAHLNKFTCDPCSTESTCCERSVIWRGLTMALVAPPTRRWTARCGWCGACSDGSAMGTGISGGHEPRGSAEAPAGKARCTPPFLNLVPCPHVHLGHHDHHSHHTVCCAQLPRLVSCMTGFMEMSPRMLTFEPPPRRPGQRARAMKPGAGPTQLAPINTGCELDSISLMHTAATLGR